MSLILLGLMLLVTISAAAQSMPDASSASPQDRRENRRETKTIQDMLAKQRALRDKKDYDEMLKRGDEALKLSEELDNSFSSDQSITQEDLKKLENLEKLVVRIRDELGGDDDEKAEQPRAPGNVAEAFRYLKDSTLRLVNELKKTTRFSISAAAIETSNSVIRMVRFLRLRR